MPLKKIELHEVNANLNQAKESAELVRSLQAELEDVLAKYMDSVKRYSAGELSREEFGDFTKSKNEDVRSLNEKVKSGVNVITASLDSIIKMAAIQEPSDEQAEKAASVRKQTAKHTKHKVAKHSKKK